MLYETISVPKKILFLPISLMNVTLEYLREFLINAVLHVSPETVFRYNSMKCTILILNIAIRQYSVFYKYSGRSIWTVYKEYFIFNWDSVDVLSWY